MKNPYTILSSKVVYENPWITLREDTNIRPDGSDGIYSVVETKDSVIIGAVNDKNEVFIIRSFSYPAQKWHWELAGGGSDDEGFITASKRELAEETGIIAKNWQQLGIVRPMDGLMPEKMAILLATDLTIGEKLPADDEGLIADGRFASIDEIHQLIDSGDMDEGQSISALYFIEHWIRENA